MTLIDIPTEQTTAATDLLISLLAVIGLAYLWRRGPTGLRALLWRGVLALLATAAFLGAIAHGIVLAEAVYSAVWKATYLALALLVAAFLLAAIRDVFGDIHARRALPFLLVIALAFFGYFLVDPDDFRPFIMYELAAMLLSLTGFLWLSWKGTLAGAGWIAASIVVNILAAGVQASGSVSFTLIWPFDHNGVFHLIQMPGIVLLVWGLKSGAAK